MLDGFRLTVEPWPRGPLGVPARAVSPILGAIQRVRALRMLKDGSLARAVDRPRLAVVESDDVEYVAPRGTRRTGNEYTLEVVR